MPAGQSGIETQGINPEEESTVPSTGRYLSESHGGMEAQGMRPVAGSTVPEGGR
ncbi:MAG: hypothetical protein QF704_02750 [Anaerolineales bacterium]|nr:hypothetical protein [Anaerolineales bacterium]